MPKRLNNDRKFPDGTGPRPDFSSLKREEATQRQADHDSLTVAQKIAKLDAKFGPGLGAKKERARLAAITTKRPVMDLSSDDLKKMAERAQSIDDSEFRPAGRKMKAKDRKAKEQEES